MTFRREKYVPRGGPSGGDGGDGGSIVFVAEPGLRTLLDFKYRQHFVAPSGVPGGSKDRSGRQGENLTVPVPLGTVVRDAADDSLIADLTEAGQQAVVARGGRGGRGNARFASSTNRAPAFAEKGEPGEERTLVLELKLIADACLVGLPNSGKSTFLGKVSAAHPKIADYPFTTLVPNLGVVAVPGREDEAFVLADIPGLIQGAHAGSGLGDKFLRHVERTRVLVHLVDVSEASGLDPVTAYEDIRRELGLYDPALAKRPEIVVATKTDLPGAEEGTRRLEEHLRELGDERRVFGASPLTGAGLTPILHAVADTLARTQVARATDTPVWAQVARATDTPVRAQVARATDTPVRAQVAAYATAEASPRQRARGGFTISVEDGVFVVRGPIERTVVMTDLGNEGALRHLHYVLKRRGVLKGLRAAGAQAGATVRIGNYEFDFVEEV